MRTARAVGLSALVFLGALAACGLPGEEVTPELPVAAWEGAPVGLEDFKGQMTAVIFFNDDNS